jgi:hypothetical protein
VVRNLRHRLEALELSAEATEGGRAREALRDLSDEELDALEDALGAGPFVRELEARVAEVEAQQRARAEESRRQDRELLARNRALAGLPPLKGEG